MADEERVVVIRAWLHADRLMIRVLAEHGPDSPVEEWVYADIAAASDRLSLLLEELRRGPTPPAQQRAPQGGSGSPRNTRR